MALDASRRKRDVTETGTPQDRAAPKSAPAYLIQQHDARRLHYDLRLELDGVLKSWAVTRGPSLVAGEKRLAVHVEDHPLDYAGFEGVIAPGRYGAGTVLLWDRGSWSPIGDARTGYAKGHLDFELHGEKLRGRWRLLRMRGKPHEKRDNWLLIKAGDDEARDRGADDVLQERPRSVKTGRDPKGIAGKMPARRRHAVATEARPAPLPDFVPPALAVRSSQAPKGEGWLHEIDFDGYRLQAHIAQGGVRLSTRNGLDWTDRVGQGLIDAFRRLPLDTALIDGAIVVETESGSTSFAALQADLRAGRTDRFIFHAFDLLHLDGRDCQALPLSARKQRLAALLAASGDPLRYSAAFADDDAQRLRQAVRISLEGLVSKRGDAPYRSGRSRDWVTSTGAVRQAFVIAGYVASAALPKAVDALILGVYAAGRLRPAGRVVRGLAGPAAQDLFTTLEALRRNDSPFAEPLAAETAEGVRYVRPHLVADIAFRGWSEERMPAHATFRGLREDMTAEDIVEDIVEDIDRADHAGDPSAMTLTHPDRLYWPEDGITKAGLADYYAEIWPRIAPFVVARPLALLRCPGGLAKTCFFQKHPWRGIGHSIRQVPDPKHRTVEPLLAIGDLDGMIALVQAGVLEIHPWGAPLADLEKPDRLIFDLDPGEGVAWAEVIAAARAIRDRLHAAGLVAFVMTSGGKGLHVSVPLLPKARWTAVRGFAKEIAGSLAADSPDRFVAVAAKAKRRGRIFIDYLRNGRGATAIAPYSTRARPGGAIAMPLAWEALDETTGPAPVTLNTIVSRLADQKDDPWRLFHRQAAPLPERKGRRQD